MLFATEGRNHKTFVRFRAINSPVQAAKAKARGYRTARNLIAMVYLTSGKLELLPTHLR